MDASLLVPIIIGVALLYDFLNGMNDAANSVATVVATRVLSPRLAVIWAATFNFLAVFIFGTAVAKAVGKGIVSPAVVDNPFVLAALLGAMIWVWACTHYGMPISVSHSLIGGMVGGAVAKGGLAAVQWWPGVGKIVVFIFLAPILGLVLGAAIMLALLFLVHRSRPQRVDRVFRLLQLASAAFYSLGHGSNDAQKVAGLITALLIANGYLDAQAEVPYGVLFLCYTAIGLGTLIGGWRVIRTLGIRVTKLQPIGGFSAETAGGLTLALTAVSGIPVSTTHTITGAIMGVGSIRRLSAVRWGVARNILIAWITTIPACGLMAGLVWWLFHLLGWD